MPFAALRAFLRPTLVSHAGATTPPTEPSAFSGSLADLAVGRPCQVTAVESPPSAPDWGRWLAEIGFIAGEPAVVTARSPWGDGSLVVRIGSSNFALRRDEARCVVVRSLPHGG
ncbi:MAG: FeoA family protein [Burkholderiaceae bacterium]